MEVSVPENFYGYCEPASALPHSEDWFIDAVDGRDLALQGQGLKIGVIDSGIDITHPFFDSKVKRLASSNFTGENHNDLNGHGTHVAGLIHQFAPLANIYDFKVLNKTLNGLWSAVEDAIFLAADTGMDVINLSLGAPFTMPARMFEAIDYALSNKIAICAASGNLGSDAVFFPAEHPGVISVGASDTDGTISEFSGTADLDLIAPGVGIYSTLPENLWGFMSGTSMASPIAAGGIALSKEKWGNEGPRMLIGRLPKDGIEGIHLEFTVFKITWRIFIPIIMFAR